MTPADEQSLTGGGDCFSHYHSEDRRPTQLTLHSLYSVSREVSVSSDYVLSDNDDFILVDTSVGNVTVTLPKAINQIEVEIQKLSSANTLIIQRQNSGDTILNQSLPVSVTVGNSSLRFKAMGSDWRII